MDIEIEKETTFACPEGRFRAELEKYERHLDYKGEQREEQARLIFVVNVPWIKEKNVKAGKNFNPDGRDLQVFLKSWLGNDLKTYMTDGKVRLEKLVGKTADIVTRHGPLNKKFKHPFVNIDEIGPVGSFNLSQTQSAKNN